MGITKIININFSKKNLKIFIFNYLNKDKTFKEQKDNKD